MTSGAHIALGKNGENLAAAILLRHNYKILARNWHYGHLELDLVCEKNGAIIFVEVKTRRTDLRGGAAGAVTETKKARLVQAAQAWLMQNEMWGRQCRFDVICLTGAAGNFRMEHYPNAIETSETVDCGHTHWQCW